MIAYQHSLYSHEEGYIDRFNELYLKWKTILPMQFTLNGIHIQFISDVFSLWINLVDTDHKIFPKVEKQLTHSYNFMRDSYLSNHVDVQEKIKKSHYNDEYCFALAYHLMYNFLDLYLSSIKGKNEMHLLDANGILNNEYYLYTDHTQFTNNTYYIVQKLLLNHLFTEFLSKDYKMKALIISSIFETNDTFLELVQAN